MQCLVSTREHHMCPWTTMTIMMTTAMTMIIMDWMCLLYGCQKVDGRAIHREQCHALLPPTATPIWQQATATNPFDDAICLLKLLAYPKRSFLCRLSRFCVSERTHPKINENMWCDYHRLSGCSYIIVYVLTFTIGVHYSTKNNCILWIYI